MLFLTSDKSLLCQQNGRYSDIEVIWVNCGQGCYAARDICTVIPRVVARDFYLELAEVGKDKREEIRGNAKVP